MTPQERTMIGQLFERLRRVAGAPRDPEAEAFIRDQIRAQPHAPYAMAQALIVQNQALEAANARIQQLEAELRDGGQGHDDRPEDRDPWGRREDDGRYARGYDDRGSGRDRYSEYDRDRAMGAPDLSRGSAPAGGPWASQQGQGPWQGQQQPARGGGFLAGAMQTALGVAGGALAFEGIRSMLGGNDGLFGGGSDAASKVADAGGAASTDVGEGLNSLASDQSGGDEGGGWFSDLFGGGEDGGDDSDWT